MKGSKVLGARETLSSIDTYDIGLGTALSKRREKRQLKRKKHRQKVEKKTKEIKPKEWKLKFIIWLGPECWPVLRPNFLFIWWNQPLSFSSILIQQDNPSPTTDIIFSIVLLLLLWTLFYLKQGISDIQSIFLFSFFLSNSVVVVFVFLPSDSRPLSSSK